MAKHRIKPFVISKLPCDRSVFTYLNNMGEQIMTPIIAFLIQGPKENIVVDTGISAEACKKYWPDPEDVTPFEDALRSVGMTPGDIDVIIQSHLHFDHCGNNFMCKNARVVVQEEELNVGRSGIYSHLPGQNYYPELFEGQDFQVVRGDQEITEGVRVLLTPGHSPGSQSVAVQTAGGTAIIAGFCCTEETFMPPGKKVNVQMPKRPEAQIPAIHINSAEAYESVMRVKRMADIILPSHGLHLEKEY
jgi:N-acyl homoserine lactone hydrolase